jgi:purine-binding chemotaxis protein CheW
MDLAKIRQKARQEQESRQVGAATPVELELPESADSREQSSTRPISDEQDFFQDVAEEELLNPVPESLPAPPSSQRIVPRDPLEAILSGREAAGCGESKSLVSETHSVAEIADYQEFLCFKVSDEVYGVDIMDIKELIKPREVTEVPRAPSFVSGVISLRGVIIPIIDMLDRLGLARETVTGRERVIVVRQGESFSGLLVNEIIQVVRIAKDNIEAAPTVLEGIDRDFVTGIGRADGRMIILLNLCNIIDIHLY